MNQNTNRLAVRSSTLRLTPPDPMPDSMTKRFPELRDWDHRNLEIWKKNVEEIGREIALAKTATEN